MKKTLIATFVFVCIFLMFPSQKIEAASKGLSKTECSDWIHVYSFYDTFKEVYDDFDGDGKKEMFALTKVNDNGYLLTAEIWFVSSKGIVCIDHNFSTFSDPDRVMTCAVSKRQKLFFLENYAGGSGSSTTCFYVKKGIPYQVDLSQGSMLQQISGKDFSLIRQDYDRNSYGGGKATDKRYYIRWTGSKFKEYKAKKISYQKFKSYKGSAAVLKRIEKAGYEVKSIYLRSNGMIHINLIRRENGNTSYENLTLHIKKKSVSLMPIESDGSDSGDFLQKYSYGGIYKSKAFSFKNSKRLVADSF